MTSRRMAPRPTRRLPALASVALLAGACGGSVILGPTPFPSALLHVVDGVTMAEERPCAEFAACDLARETAVSALGLDPASVTGVRLAATGPAAGGFWSESAVVLDLVDGSRRAVVVDCGAFNSPPVTCRAQPKASAGG